MTFGFGIQDWLSHPDPHARCSLGLAAKKVFLLFISFALLLMLAVFQYLSIEKFFLIFPSTFVHAILFLFELIAFLFFIHGLLNEHQNLALPFAISQFVRSVLLGGVIGYYIASLFREQNLPPEHQDGHYLKWTSKLLGHLFALLIGHLFLGYIGWASFKVLKCRLYNRPKDYSHSTSEVPHNVIVLEQPIEQAMYGKKNIISDDKSERLE